MAGAEFWTDRAAAAATLPDGLTPDPETAGRGTVLFIDWQYSGSRDEYLDPVRSQYHEFFVLLDARWQDAPVARCTYIYVDNDHALAAVKVRVWRSRIASAGSGSRAGAAALMTGAA